MFAKVSDYILQKWRGYTDEAAFIFSETDGVPHNTITPIARMNGNLYEMDLVLQTIVISIWMGTIQVQFLNIIWKYIRDRYLR